MVGSGTGLYLEKLLVFETYDTAHMDPYELSGEKLEEEIGRLLDYRVDTAKKTVDITERETGRVIVGGLSYKLEDNEDAGFGGVSYGSHIRYALGDQIYLYVGVGIMNSVFPNRVIRERMWHSGSFTRTRKLRGRTASGLQILQKAFMV